MGGGRMKEGKGRQEGEAKMKRLWEGNEVERKWRVKQEKGVKEGRMRRIMEVKRKMGVKGRGGNGMEKKGRVEQRGMERNKEGGSQRRIKEVISRSRFKGWEEQA